MGPDGMDENRPVLIKKAKQAMRKSGEGYGKLLAQNADLVEVALEGESIETALSEHLRLLRRWHLRLLALSSALAVIDAVISGAVVAEFGRRRRDAIEISGTGSGGGVAALRLWRTEAVEIAAGSAVVAGLCRRLERAEPVEIAAVRTRSC